MFYPSYNQGLMPNNIYGTIKRLDSMSTVSLRRDHDLITKVLKAMESTVSMLRDGKQIPEPILNQVIDFSTNFTDVCHHSKEEKSLFPSLEKAGLPKNAGPITMMLMDHQRQREIAKNMDVAAKTYLESGDPTSLIGVMNEYIQHVTEHLWKENNRLFMMAEARLQHVASKVDRELGQIEDEKLGEIGKSRQYYEDLAHNLEKHILE